MNGILVAITVMTWTLESSGRLAMKATARPTSAASMVGSTATEPLMDVAHVANAVVHMASLPLDANVLFMTVMATKMPLVGRG